jgi:predicted GNAT family N-acyltransferase
MPSTSSLSSSVTSFSVTLDDGTVVPYIRRGLRQEDDDELRRWAEFCASVFADKNPPPPAAYFERHYKNDPLARLDWIRIVLWNDQIVSSCRIFHRDVSLGCATSIADTTTTTASSVHAGGIGEVCTSKQHRHRGLSKLLLQDSLSIMKSSGFVLSFLHAAPGFFPFYERGGGYSSTKSEWSLARIHIDLLKNYQCSNDVLSSGSIRLAELPHDTTRLQVLHREYSERNFVVY